MHRREQSALLTRRRASRRRASAGRCTSWSRLLDVALDYLAWVSRTTLELIERELGPGRDLLEFFTVLAPPLAPTPPAVEVGPERPAEYEEGRR